MDANIYEDEPIWVMGLTIGWGAAAGIGFGLIALAVEPSVGSVIVNGTSQYLVVQGLILPFCGFFVLLLGPLILLRYQRFNDVLDGVAFGATAAAWFSGAQAVTYGVHLIGAGLRPGGAMLPWIWRLLSLAVGMPVLTMGAAAAACAALWLRYRAPARDANALGALGHQAVALPLAGLLVMGGAVGETFLPAGGWLAWRAAFDVVAISLLVRATAGTIDRLFGLRLTNYRGAGGRHFHAPIGKAIVPRDLRSVVVAVAGLNNASIERMPPRRSRAWGRRARRWPTTSTLWRLGTSRARARRSPWSSSARTSSRTWMVSTSSSACRR